MIRQSTVSLGEHRGSPRVYLQGDYLHRAGFQPRSTFRATFARDKVTLELDSAGERVVSSKKAGAVPVIDLNTGSIELSAKKLSVSVHQGRIEITPAYTVMLVTSRALEPTEGSIFSGGGILSEAARQAGFEPVFAVEVNDRYADIYQANHPNATVYNASVEDVDWDELRRYRPLGLMTMGIPCEPHSLIRRLDRGGQKKRDKSLPNEAHELGDMVFWTLRAIEAANPNTVLIENVPGFLQSASNHILQAVLRRMGYTVDARIVDPLEYESLTGRKRAVVLAHTGPTVRWPEPVRGERRLADILDPEPHDWFDRQSKSWVFDHWEKQTAKGNGFAAPRLMPDATHVGTIKKRYFAGQGDNPVVQHPSDPSKVRWFTLPEVMRLHDIPDTYFVGDSKTTAGEVIGQGVHVSTMRRIIESVTGGSHESAAA